MRNVKVALMKEIIPILKDESMAPVDLATYATAEGIYNSEKVVGGTIILDEAKVPGLGIVHDFIATVTSRWYDGTTGELYVSVGTGHCLNVSKMLKLVEPYIV